MAAHELSWQLSCVTFIPDSSNHVMELLELSFRCSGCPSEYVHVDAGELWRKPFTICSMQQICEAKQVLQELVHKEHLAAKLLQRLFGPYFLHMQFWVFQLLLGCSSNRPALAEGRCRSSSSFLLIPCAYSYMQALLNNTVHASNLSCSLWWCCQHHPAARQVQHGVCWAARGKTFRLLMPRQSPPNPGEAR
jgi:hypothetical protein